MNLTTMVVILFFLAAIWWLVRKRQSNSTVDSQSTGRSAQKSTAFHAVSIKLSGHACDAARAIVGRRFLASAAPSLPLPDCDVLECNCRFGHYDDRRSGKDRRSPFGRGGTTGGTGSFEAEQRSGEDRRTDDDEY